MHSPKSMQKLNEEKVMENFKTRRISATLIALIELAQSVGSGQLCKHAVFITQVFGVLFAYKAALTLPTGPV